MQDSPICAWRDGSRKFALYVSPESVGSAARGILLGRTETRRSSTIFFVESFRAVESERRLADEIRKSGNSCLGIYRSQTLSKRLPPDRAEAQVFERSFGPGNAVFLKFIASSHTALVFSRVDGTLKCVGEFAQPLLLSQRARSAPVKGWSWIAAAAVVTLLVGSAAGMLTDSLHRPIAPNRDAPRMVELRVQPDGSALRLVWDPSSPTLHDSARLVLHVQDGGYRSDRDLSISEFRKGSTTYQPQSGDVIFRMDAYKAQPNASGLIRVINSPPAVTKRQGAVPISR